MSYEQNVKEFESVTLGVAIFDEPPPLNVLYATIARMRRGGLILIFMTPLDTGGEILEDLSEKESVVVENEEIGRIYVSYAEIEDSCEEHGVRGFLKHKDIVQMLAFYDSEEIDARAKGKPVHLTGRVYSDFENKNPYVVEDFVIPDDWSKVNIVDPHDGIPFAITWAAVDRTGQIWVYDEFPFEDLEKCHTSNLTIPDYARIIREKESRDSIALRIGDPYFMNKRYGNTGKTVKEELGDLGLDFVDGDTSGLDLGHKRVREFLKYQKAYPVSGVNHPRLHVLKRCRNHWRSMLRYKRKVLKSGEVKDKIVLDETYKHFCDNLRHLIMYPGLLSLQRIDSDTHYKTVGELKDIRFIDDGEDEHSLAYQQATGKL
jgi:phage terminase large subunit-like protein